MLSNHFKSNFVLILVAIVWGSGFIAQRYGLDYVGPFTYNSLRFGLGAFILLPILKFYKAPLQKWLSWRGFLLGILLTLAAGLQQVGIAYSTASKAAFITGTYIVFVPLFSYLFFRTKVSFLCLLGVFLVLIGMYLLSVQESIVLSKGDTIILLCALAFAWHVIAVGKIAPQNNPLQLAIIQFFTVSLLSGLLATLLESPALSSIFDCSGPVLYSAFLPIGFAYTAQIFAQRNTSETEAGILMSLEAVFGAFFGVWLLNEQLTPPQLFGCVIMFVGIIVSQLKTDNLLPRKNASL